MKNIELKAIRQGIGLSVLDASQLCNVSKRTFQYWESGKVAIRPDIKIFMSLLASHYALVLDILTADIEKATWLNTDPDNDDRPMRISPSLPFYYSFESFQMASGNSNIYYWRIYQAVLSHLIIIGKFSRLNDEISIPSDWGIWKWFNMEYEAK